MNENDMIIYFYEALEGWKKSNPKKTDYQVYEDLLELLSIAADELGFLKNVN